MIQNSNYSCKQQMIFLVQNKNLVDIGNQRGNSFPLHLYLNLVSVITAALLSLRRIDRKKIKSVITDHRRNFFCIGEKPWKTVGERAQIWRPKRT